MRRRTADRRDRQLSRSSVRTMRDYAKMNHTLKPHDQYPYDAAFPRKVDFFVGQTLKNVGRLGGGDVRWRIVKILSQRGPLSTKWDEVAQARKLSDRLVLKLSERGYDVSETVVVGQVIYSATWRMSDDYRPESPEPPAVSATAAE